MPIVKLKKGVKTYEHDPSASRKGPFYSLYLKFSFIAVLSFLFFYINTGAYLINSVNFNDIPDFTIYSDIFIFLVIVFITLMISKYLGNRKKIVNRILFIFLLSFIVYLPMTWFSSYTNSFSSATIYTVSDRIPHFIINSIIGLVGPYWGALAISFVSELFWTHLEYIKKNK